MLNCTTVLCILQTDEASVIHTEAEMQQASDAMQEALKGNSAASAALNDMDIDEAAKEMVSAANVECEPQDACSAECATQCVSCRYRLQSTLSCDRRLRTWASVQTSETIKWNLLQCWLLTMTAMVVP